MISRPEPLRLHWDVESGWILDTQVLLTDRQLEGIVKWALPKQTDRWRGLPAGSKKDELEKALPLLAKGKVQQRLLERDGILTPFAATTRTSSTHTLLPAG